MKILLISYNYGGTASGIMSMRMALALVKQGCCVRVLAGRIDSNSKLDSLDVEVVKESLLWSRFLVYILKVLLKIVGCSSYNFNLEWRFRAKRKASEIVKTWNPDIVYCRTTPTDPCYVGLYLKRVFNGIVVQHFTDPIPPPKEYSTSFFQNVIFKRLACKVLSDSDYVSYGNEYMRDFVLKNLGFNNSSHYFISPDIAPRSAVQYFSNHSNSVIRLVYLGTIYQSRNPYPLFEAIKVLNSKGINILLDIYSGEVKKITDSIECHTYVKNTMDVMGNADILVDLDGDDLIPVYISSKLKEYLTINRPILSITPLSSPSRELLKGLSTCTIVENHTSDICNGLMKIIEEGSTNSSYDERIQVIEKFAPATVASIFIQTVTRSHD